MSRASAIVGKSWCLESAGHTDEWDRANQRCFELERPVRLSTESLGLCSDSTVQQCFAASLEQQADATAPQVCIGLNEDKGSLATLDEARRLAYEILALVDQGRAQEWKPGLKRASPEMIPLHTHSQALGRKTGALLTGRETVVDAGGTPGRRRTMSSRTKTPSGARRWWPYLGVVGLFWAVPGGLLLVGYLALPDYITSSQCEGSGFGCALTPKDGTVVLAIYVYPLLVVAGLLIMAVMATGRAWRHRSR
jgi:hypothetical protein